MLSNNKDTLSVSSVFVSYTGKESLPHHLFTSPHNIWVHFTDETHFQTKICKNLTAKLAWNSMSELPAPTCSAYRLIAFPWSLLSQMLSCDSSDCQNVWGTQWNHGNTKKTRRQYVAHTFCCKKHRSSKVKGPSAGVACWWVRGVNTGSDRMMWVHCRSVISSVNVNVSFSSLLAAKVHLQVAKNSDPFNLNYSNEVSYI